MKIGFYGGTFDPIHHGHLILARDALETLALERVIFLPAKVSPFKLSSLPAPAELRVRLLKTALQDEPNFTWDPCELEREGPSYTVDTIRLMRTRFPKAEFYYFIGDDHLKTLSAWKEYSLLIHEVRFVVLNRGNVRPDTPFPIIERRLDISATDIRNRLSRGLSIRYLVPETVRKILLESNGYGR